MWKREKVQGRCRNHPQLILYWTNHRTGNLLTRLPLLLLHPPILYLVLHPVKYSLTLTMLLLMMLKKISRREKWSVSRNQILKRIIKSRRR